VFDQTPTITREALAAMRLPAFATGEERAAVWRLIEIAKTDTNQARHVADFLLAWWNPKNCGGFDLRNLWAVDSAIADDMQTVFGLIARVHEYPTTIDPAFDAAFRSIVREWHPEMRTS